MMKTRRDITTQLDQVEKFRQMDPDNDLIPLLEPLARQGKLPEDTLLKLAQGLATQRTLAQAGVQAAGLLGATPTRGSAEVFPEQWSLGPQPSRDPMPARASSWDIQDPPAPAALTGTSNLQQSPLDPTGRALAPSPFATPEREAVRFTARPGEQTAGDVASAIDTLRTTNPRMAAAMLKMVDLTKLPHEPPEQGRARMARETAAAYRAAGYPEAQARQEGIAEAQGVKRPPTPPAVMAQLQNEWLAARTSGNVDGMNAAEDAMTRLHTTTTAPDAMTRLKDQWLAANTRGDTDGMARAATAMSSLRDATAAPTVFHESTPEGTRVVSLRPGQAPTTTIVPSTPMQQEYETEKNAVVGAREVSLDRLRALRVKYGTVKDPGLDDWIRSLTAQRQETQRLTRGQAEFDRREVQQQAEFNRRQGMRETASDRRQAAQNAEFERRQDMMRTVGASGKRWINRAGEDAEVDLPISQAVQQKYFAMTSKEEAVITGAPKTMAMLANLVETSLRLRDAGGLRSAGGVTGVVQRGRIAATQYLGDPAGVSGLLTQWAGQKSQLYTLYRDLGEKGNLASRVVTPQLEALNPSAGFPAIIKALKQIEGELSSFIKESRMPGFADRVAKMPDLLDVSDQKYGAARQKVMADPSLQEERRTKSLDQIIEQRFGVILVR